MSNLAPFLLVVVIITLTFLIALVAIQVFQVLHEARQAIRKFNQLLDDPQNLNQLKNLQPQDRVIEQPAKKQLASESPKKFFHRSGSQLRPRN